jgi:hypothetical protein
MPPPNVTLKNKLPHQLLNGRPMLAIQLGRKML